MADDLERDSGGAKVTTNGGTKKRRVQRACDLCRRKKIRCDAMSMADQRCSICLAANVSCTYLEEAKKKGPSKKYVLELETKVQKMEKLLHAMLPEEELEAFLDDKSSWKHRDDLPQRAGTVEDFTTEIEHKYLIEPEHVFLEQASEHYKDQTMGFRYVGKSSGIQLIQSAVELKYGVRENDPFQFPRGRPEFWQTRPWKTGQLDHFVTGAGFTFPPDDLIWSLVDIYFERFNVLVPLLHRPTFEKLIREKQYLRDHMLASLLLLVCAVSSRYSDDPRVLVEGEESKQSSGWKWVHQVMDTRNCKPLLGAPSLYDLQVLCLFSEFLMGSSVFQLSWTIVGIGIRLAQDAGGHRRKANNAPNTVEAEMWKRAFWSLIYMDRLISSLMGRPLALGDEEIDIDLPTECDDEYWEAADPNQAFKQPAGKPSVVSYFNCCLRLSRLLTFCLRTIYSIKKSRVLLGFLDPNWESEVVADLDSALNKWIDTIPAHLRWDPNRANLVHFNQSASLYMLYYHLQKLIHRPFITKSQDSNFRFPSLAICTNAARASSHIADLQRRRAGVVPVIGLLAFDAGIVLLFNIWGGKRSGLSLDPYKEMDDVHKCMKVLRSLDSRWQFAGQLWDILYELASVGDLPLPNNTPSPSNKRGRDEDEDEEQTSTESSGYSSEPYPLPDGPQDVSNFDWPIEHSVPLQTFGLDVPLESLQLHDVPLPMNSAELGRGNPTGMPTAAEATYYYDSSDLFTADDSQPIPEGMAGMWTTDDRAMAMWNSVPNTFEMDDWNTYLTSFNDLSHRNCQ
ncbi:fungal-specific transcription factor domain-containing protein [Desarmillaria tabescens]|uniref:Fungal-specific transcription factor domain-containing protein n=1 Tax=Armillaria tabescens TaxID=1929756 RepID=A0AA39N4P1_ARMTA|nr:fungal-specific transcription factor domain-containing protein [Desarmillaria tabescens]KAK0457309.1 fungal-specific transcription factor domain-containing protein [Desarmillaria tabescens]